MGRSGLMYGKEWADVWEGVGCLWASCKGEEERFCRISVDTFEVFRHRVQVVTSDNDGLFQ